MTETTNTEVRVKEAKRIPTEYCAFHNRKWVLDSFRFFLKENNVDSEGLIFRTPIMVDGERSLIEVEGDTKLVNDFTNAIRGHQQTPRVPEVRHYLKKEILSFLWYYPENYMPEHEGY